MRRILIALSLLSLSLPGFFAWTANTKLYLKDGTYQIVREYQVQTDRVRYYSAERSDWEEIPLDMVDMKRTTAEAAARQEQTDKNAKMLADDEEARRAMKKEVSRIPNDAGAYWLDGAETRVMTAAESTLHTNKGRSVWQKLSPIPNVPGAATLEIQGAHSLNVLSNPEQEFYIQLSETEAFGIAKLSSKTGIRVVEDIIFAPVTKDVEENIAIVDTVQQELTPNGLYKFWPKDKLAPGEYAVVEYTPNKMNIQIWDFAIKAK